MSTVAIIATKLTIDIHRQYRQRMKNGTDKIFEVDFFAGDIVASKVYYDGYPKLDDPLQDDPGILNHLYNSILSWESYPLLGNRRGIGRDEFVGNPTPYTFKERLDFDVWCKENWDADYLYWIDGPNTLRYCELHHWDPDKNFEVGKIDYDYPNGPWVRFAK